MWGEVAFGVNKGKGPEALREGGPKHWVIVSTAPGGAHIIMPCRSVTAGQLGVKPGLGAGQSIWYMGELNQFIAPILLSAQPTAAIATNRHLQHDNKETADAVLTNRAIVSLQQQAQLGQTTAHKLQEGIIAVPQGLERQSQRAVLQAATDSKIQEAVTDIAAAAPVVPSADEVGEVYMYTADNIRAIAPLWWNYTIQMRVFHETHKQVRGLYTCPFSLWPRLFHNCHDDSSMTAANRSEFCIKQRTSNSGMLHHAQPPRSAFRHVDNPSLCLVFVQQDFM